MRAGVVTPGVREFPVIPRILDRTKSGHVKAPGFPPNPGRFESSNTATAMPANYVFRIVGNANDLSAQSQIEMDGVTPKPKLVGESQAIRTVRDLIERVAPTNAKVFITGETGTGKELVAKAIHENSTRADKPFIPVNCAAISKDTIESVLFGHESGAFTDAGKEKAGLFEAANGGTLFLDEIGELEPHLQAKLARVIEYGTFQRVGGSKEHKVNVRLLTATNRDVAQAVKEGKITRGLYDRISVVHIHMPPLRDRKDDIESIANFLLYKHRFSVPGKLSDSFSTEALQKLEAQNWPGNVRELENVIRRAIILASGPVIEPEDIALTKEETSAKMLENIDELAISDYSALVTGETGTGKELVSRYIHQNSRRSPHPLITVNCSTLKPELAESHLFGHVKGAFTGAVAPHKGLFEQAEGSTLFLDEVAELDLNVQSKLLRVLQEGEITVMGANVPKKVNVRIIAATNCDLEEAVRQGKFREDLYYRLNVAQINIPPLRERLDQIPDLALQFIEELKGNKNITGITHEALEKLSQHSWAGNIRELKAVIERAIVFTEDGVAIEPNQIVFSQLEIANPSETNHTLNHNGLHPVLAKYLEELAAYAKKERESDDDKLWFLGLKCRIVQMLLDSNARTIPETKIADDLKVNRNTLRKRCIANGYDSTKELIEKLAKEIYG